MWQMAGRIQIFISHGGHILLNSKSVVNLSQCLVCFSAQPTVRVLADPLSTLQGD